MKRVERIPESVVFSVTREGHPVPDIMILSEFGVVQKNPYSMVFGPTNSRGRIEVSRGMISETAGSQYQFALMDYCKIDEVFSGVITANVMSADDTKNALQAYSMFKDFMQYPDRYQETLERYSTILPKLDIVGLTVDLVVS